MCIAYTTYVNICVEVVSVLMIVMKCVVNIVCMYVYIYIYIHIHTHIYIYIYIYIHIYIYIYIMYTHMHNICTHDTHIGQV